jgi:PAS domain S-box-containing protein
VDETRLLEELAGDLAFGIVALRSRAERRRAEEALRESERKYHELVEHANSIILHWQRDGRIVHLNEFGQRFFGYADSEIRGCHVIGTIVPDTESRGRDLNRLMDEIGANPSAFEQNVNENMRRNGERVWIAWTNKVALNSKGEVTEILSIGVDITERKRAEEALRRSEAYLAEGQRLSHTGSWAWSPINLQPLYFSDEMFRIFGFDPRQGLPGSEAYRQRLHPEDRDGTYEFLQKLAQQASEYEHEHRIVRPDGAIRHIRALGHPVRDESGQLIEYVGTAMDVTEHKLAEDELRKHRDHLEDLVRQRTEQLAEAKSRAEAANCEKSRFLANMSHELRTPLNAVLGFSRLLKGGPDVTPRQQEELDIILRSGEHLLNLINNVLDMAKIESGSVALEESEVDLHQLVHEIQSLMGVGASEKGLGFTLQRAPDLPRFVAVDASKLRQVLLNLVGNAIKYTETGGVTLRARLADIAISDRTQVRFEVEDTGPGIIQENCKRIFLPFVQVGTQTSVQVGTGLGLAICKQYVELMGGRIGVDSEPGKGSVFHFSIPVRVVPSVAESDEPMHGRVLGLAQGQPRYRLLIVEDQPENRLLLRRLLEPLGFELQEAVNGQEAVALFEQWHPDLIWMDIRMPVMDGLEAVRRIRASKAGAETKVIALTAHALEEERRPIMAAGCDDFVRKPFQEHEIFDALARHLHLSFVYEQPRHPESAPHQSGLALIPGQLERLPAELLQELRQAVIELDTARTLTLIAQVTERDPSLGRTFHTLATQLDYKRLSTLLKRDQPQAE